jgi:hypothetical protein
MICFARHSHPRQTLVALILLSLMADAPASYAQDTMGGNAAAPDSTNKDSLPVVARPHSGTLEGDSSNGGLKGDSSDGGLKSDNGSGGLSGDMTSPAASGGATVSGSGSAGK